MLNKLKKKQQHLNKEKLRKYIKTKENAKSKTNTKDKAIR